MWETNSELMKKEREMNGTVWTPSKDTRGGAGKGKEQEMVVTEEQERGAKYLVDHWGLLNLGRAVLMGAAAVLGLGASYI